MIILLNGPLGIGKSTLAECLMERLERTVMLDGDHCIAVNPAPDNAMEYLHETLALLVAHHRRAGYEHFVINHIWESAHALNDLRGRLLDVAPNVDIRTFLLTLPYDENLRRIEKRQHARAIDEAEFERATVTEERSLLYSHAPSALGDAFDVSAAPEQLVDALLLRLGLNPSTSTLV